MSNNSTIFNSKNMAANNAQKAALHPISTNSEHSITSPVLAKINATYQQ